MKKLSLFTMVSLLLFPGLQAGVIIDIDGASDEFEDYSGLSSGDTWATMSFVTESGYTLSTVNPTNRVWNETNYQGARKELDLSIGLSSHDDNSTSFSDSITEGKYWEIKLTGSSFDLESISVNLWRNGTGAAQYYQFAYDDEGTGYDVGDALGTAFNASSTGIGSQYLVSYSGLGLPSSTTDAKIALFSWGGSSGTGNTHFNKIAAEYSVIPEPGSMALLILGFAGFLTFCKRKA